MPLFLFALLTTTTAIQLYSYAAKPQGVIVIGQITSKALSLLKSNVRCPVVFIDYYLENEKHFNFVLIDSFASMYFLVKHLIQDYHYHDLCFVGSIHKTASILDRYLGYVKALRENGLDHCIYNVLPDRDQGNNDQIQIELPAQEQFTLPELFVCNCDRTAQILIKELHKRGIRVPEQVSVCGFDNYMEQDDSEFNSLGKIKIHTYDHNPQQLSQVALENLMQQIMTNHAPHLTFIKGQIVQGNSVKPLPLPPTS